MSFSQASPHTKSIKACPPRRSECLLSVRQRPSNTLCGTKVSENATALIKQQFSCTRNLAGTIASISCHIQSGRCLLESETIYQNPYGNRAQSDSEFDQSDTRTWRLLSHARYPVEDTSSPVSLWTQPEPELWPEEPARAIGFSFYGQKPKTLLAYQSV